MFWQAFKITGSAVFQIFLLGAIGFVLTRRKFIAEQGLEFLSKLVVDVSLPLLIFSQLIRDFSFQKYPFWWGFTLLSIGITLLGLGLGFLFSYFIRGKLQRRQFISLVGFQNSGYLPLALIPAMLPQELASTMLIYLFLFLLGFNLLVWSFGAAMLSTHQESKFDYKSLFSPPVISTLASLALIFLGLNVYVPQALLKPIRMIGDCTVPLAMLVVGGNLAMIKLKQVDKLAMILVVLCKLIILPVIGLWLALYFKFPPLIGLLILMELAVPPATSLAVITRRYKKEDLLVSQGIFFGHIVGLLTLPLFLSIYFARVMLK